MKDTFRLENQTIYFGTERAISASPQTIWRYLTETDKLKQWFPELEIGELGVNGFWRFILPDFEETMPFTDYAEEKYLGVTWDTGIIYFDLKEQAPHQTLLVFSESLPENFTTPRHKDIAGWSIVLNRLKQVVETPDAAPEKNRFSANRKSLLGKINEFRKLKSVAQRVNHPLCHTF